MPTELNRMEWAVVRRSFGTPPKGGGQDPSNSTSKPKRRRRLFSQNFIESEKSKLEVYRSIFRDIMKQYSAQGVYLDLNSGNLS